MDEETRLKVLGENNSNIEKDNLKLNGKAEKILFSKVSSNQYSKIQAIAQRTRAYFKGDTRVRNPESEFLKAVSRFEVYRDLDGETGDVKLDEKKNIPFEPEGIKDLYNNLDFQNGTVVKVKEEDENTGINSTSLLSTTFAVQKDLEDAYNNLESTEEAKEILQQTEETVVVSIPASQFAKLEMEDGQPNRNAEGKPIVEMNMPGIVAFFRLMERKGNQNVRLDLRVTDNINIWQDEILKGFPADLQNKISFSDELTDANSARDSRNALVETYETANDNVVIVTDGELRGINNEFIKNNDLKIFQTDRTTALPCTLLFGVFYGLTKGAITDEGKLSETILNALKLLGMDETEIAKIRSEGILFFTMKLTRLRDTLQQFQINRVTIAVAA